MNAKPKGNGERNPEIVFDYIKSPSFRSIHVDGAIGALTPTGIMHVALYNERPAIPRQMVHPLSPDGTLGEEISERRVVREGVVREMEVDAYLSLPAAKSLCQWLQTKIEELEKTE